MKPLFEVGETVKGAVTRLSAYKELSRFSSDEIEKAWGLACSFDIYDCNPETIRDAGAIKQFVYKLCDLIEMKRFGDCVVVNFGEDERVAGFSMMQLIETSLISAHFANATNTTYLDVFSCKPYSPAVVEEFALNFFGGSRCITHVNLRQ
ncbi:MAG: S-adenosylmethionine decarboxylase [Candidatus Zixiibacteriota bacterium]